MDSNEIKTQRERLSELKMKRDISVRRAEQATQKATEVFWMALAALVVGFAGAYGNAKGRQFAEPRK